ncbi:MAG: antitoxin family protein [Armatimonadota bacterium]|nr:antitoxin family protein [bacterium]MDW8322098.1 antitoxin family protein [Armatimonadota bacterium]
MKTLIHARYDGKVLIPEEPLQLEEGQIVRLEIIAPACQSEASLSRERRRQALRQLVATAVEGASIPDEALRRENLYED